MCNCELEQVRTVPVEKGLSTGYKVVIPTTNREECEDYQRCAYGHFTESSDTFSFDSGSTLFHEPP